jgi:hypothetical protein
VKLRFSVSNRERTFSPFSSEVEKYCRLGAIGDRDAGYLLLS